MKFGIIGAGFAGMSAALDLVKAGHEVTVFERSPNPGGLAIGFKDTAWDWYLEHFYHHWFETDDDIINLMAEVGVRDKLFFPPSTTSIFYQGNVYPFGTPPQMLKFLIPKLGLINTARFGFTGLYLRTTKNWQMLEQYTAREWLIKTMGRRVYQVLWEPLLIGKFGQYHQEVNMAWLWARLHKRSFKLGYFEGGFQALSEAVCTYIQQQGVNIHFNTPIEKIDHRAADDIRLHTPTESHAFERVIAVTAPHLFSKLTPKLPESYLADLKKLRSMGAVVIVLALKQQLTEEHYWINLPKQEDLPFLALVEHTNFIDPKFYNGDRIVYCGDYLNTDHPYFSMSKAELLDLFLPTLTKFNPNFTPDWVRESWLFCAPYAQPVPFINHSQNIPPLETPLPGLYWASMSQVYPWDRGTNYAVEIGREAARQAMGKA